MVGLLSYLSAICIKISQMVQAYDENNKPVQRFCGFLCGLPHQLSQELISWIELANPKLQLIHI